MQLQTLSLILAKALPAKDDSWAQRSKKALLSLRKEKQVDHIETDLPRCMELLTFHCVLPRTDDRLQKLSPQPGIDVDNENKLCQYFEVPYRQGSQFLCREILADTEHSFRTSTVVVLYGNGIQGKTQIALEYCRQSKESNTYRGIFWVDAASELLLKQSFESIAEVINPPRRVFDSVDQIINFVQHTLEESIQSWLLVFDNYNIPTNLPDIFRFSPSQVGKILITTRHPDISRSGHIISLDVKTNEVTEEYICKLSTKLFNFDCESRRLVTRTQRKWKDSTGYAAR